MVLHVCHELWLENLWLVYFLCPWLLVTCELLFSVCSACMSSMVLHVCHELCPHVCHELCPHVYHEIWLESLWLVGLLCPWFLVTCVLRFSVCSSDLCFCMYVMSYVWIYHVYAMHWMSTHKVVTRALCHACTLNGHGLRRVHNVFNALLEYDQRNECTWPSARI